MQKQILRMSWALILVLVIVTVVRLLSTEMSWGVMDDAGWMHRFAAGDSSLSTMEFLREKLAGDIRWGLFRPTYFLWVRFAYGFLGTSLGVPPNGIYLLCFGIYLAIGGLFAWVSASWMARWKPQESRAVMVTIFFLVYLSFTPGLNLINLISLQEKWALFFAGGTLLALSRNHRLADGLALGSWMLALGAKATIFVYWIPVLFAIALKPETIRYRQILGLTWCLLTAAAVLFARKIAASGTYTSRYLDEVSSFQWDRLFSRYLEIGGPWAKVVLVLGLLSWAWGFWQRKVALRRSGPPKVGEKTLLSLVLLIWPTTLWVLLAVMLPWGVFGYYWTVFLPLVSGAAMVMMVSVADRFPRFPLQSLALIGLSLTATWSMGPKLERLIQRSTDTAHLVEWIQSAEARDRNRFWLPPPCQEATGALATLSGRSGVARLATETSRPQPQDAWITWWECPSFGDRQKGLQLWKDFGNWRVYTRRGS